jgi:hypothetical protein
MISVDLARRLSSAGVMWQPEPGDRFTIDEPDLLGDLFWVSDLTIELHHYQDQSVLGFNGTTEWALDSIAQDEVVWLPHEAQLRELLGPAFRRLEPAGDGWAVEAVAADGRAIREIDLDAERAYARALLALLA